MDVLPLAEVKAHLSELVSQVQQHHDQIMVTRNGRAAAIVISIDEWESLLETIAVLADTEAVGALRRAREEIAQGDVFDTEDVLAAFEARRGKTGG
jgi:prevent-host-death family protein